MALIKYRPEIDGLRTLAVLAVLVYHAEFLIGKQHLLKGGFFGVDIFFVISGFLITSLITKEIDITGKFSFLNFYERRTRRLLPVLIFVFLFSFPFAWVSLLPAYFVDFAKSIIASNVFLSNVYWYESLQVYGAEASSLKPFLHTWSLAVEEQYYFIFPLILLAALRWLKTHVIAVLTFLTLASLQFAEIMSGIDSSFSFYLLFSRFWELLIGSLLAYTIHLHPEKDNDVLLTKIMPSIGLYLILYSMVFLDLNSNHPGFVTLMPVVGTVLIIWFSNKNEFVTKILSSRVFVSIGLISYSLYLWHFPIFAFLRIEGMFDSLLFKLSAFILVFLLSVISYKFIEQPFRSKTKISTKYFYIFIISSTFLILATSYLVIKNDGYPDRFKSGIAPGAKEMLEYRQKYWQDHSAYTNIEDFSKDKFSVEVIGNSWAQDIANSLIEKSDYEVSFRGRTGSVCKAITLNALTPQYKEFDKWQTRCANNVDRFKVKLLNTDLVILADNYWMTTVDNEDVAKEVLKNIELLREYGYKGPVMVISNRPTYKKGVFAILNEHGSFGEEADIYAMRYAMPSLESLKKQDVIAKRFYENNKIYYYSLIDSLCSQNRCKINHNGMPLYHDEAHLTMSGAKYIGSSLIEFINTNIIK